jgi:hypothetical protein
LSGHFAVPFSFFNLVVHSPDGLVTIVILSLAFFFFPLRRS